MKVVVAAHVDTVIGETANVVVADGGSVDEWNSVKGEYKEVIVDRWDTQNTILPDEEVPLGPENQEDKVKVEDQVKVEEPLIEISLISDGKTIETKIVSTYIDGSERNINMVGELGKKTSIQIKVKTSVRMQSSDISLVQKGENAGYVIYCHDFEEPSGRKESAAGFTFYNATSGLLNLKLNITWPSKTAEMEGITRKIPDENESVGLSRSGDVWSGTVPAGTESVNLTALGVDEWATVSCGNKSVQGNGINLPKLDYSLKLVNGKGECEFKVTSEDGKNTKICPIVITTAAESEPDPKKELVEEEKKSEVQKVPDMILSSEEEQVESIE